jgi:hypothetical protein
MLKNHALFRGAPSHFINALASSLSITVYSPTESIIAPGDTVRGAFFLCRGVARIMMPERVLRGWTQVVKGRIIAGGYFQSQAIVRDDVIVEEAIIAETFCEVYILTRLQVRHRGGEEGENIMFVYSLVGVCCGMCCSVCGSGMLYRTFHCVCCSAYKSTVYLTCGDVPLRFFSTLQFEQVAASSEDFAGFREEVTQKAAVAEDRGRSLDHLNGEQDAKRRRTCLGKMGMARVFGKRWRREGSTFRNRFQALNVIGLFIYMVLLPVHLIAYYDGDATPCPTLVIAVLVLMYLSDFVAICDITFNVMGHFTFTHEGADIDDPARIRSRYLKMWGGADIIAAVPLEIIGLALGGGAGSISVWRMNKMLRLYHVSEYFSFLERGLLVKLGGMSHRIVRLFALLLNTLHWSACIWLLLGQAGQKMDSDTNGTVNNWIDDDLNRDMKVRRDMHADSHFTRVHHSLRCIRCVVPHVFLTPPLRMYTHLQLQPYAE